MKWSLVLFAACVSGAAWVAPSVLGQSPTTAPAVKVDPKKQFDAMIQAGSDALAVGDAKAARDSFSDAVQLDPKSARAMHGLAIAYFKLGDFAKAGATIDKALAFPGAADHAMVYNAGVIQIQNKAAMRAAKVTREYLNAKPLPLDEPVVNVLGLSLARADAQAQKNSYYVDTKGFYDKYIKRLEAANPGFQRWGASWLPADEVQEKAKVNATAQAKVNDLTKQVADVTADLANARKKLASADAEMKRRGFEGEFSRHSLRDDVDRLEARQTDKTRDLDEVTAKLIKPDPLPDITALLPMDAPVPPISMPVPKPVTVAISDPPKNGNTDPDRPRTIRHRTPRPIEGSGANPNDPNMKPPVPNEKPAEVVKPAEIPATPVKPEPAQHKKIRLTTYAAAFPVGSDLLITTAAAVEGAEDIKLQARDGNVLSATLVRSDPESGLALVRVKGYRMAFFELAEPEAGKFDCAAFPEVNIFNPSGEMLPGTTGAATGKWTIKLARQPRLAGAPIIQHGKVVGVAMGQRDSDLANFPAVPVSAIKKLLGQDTPLTGGQNPDPITVLMHLSASREREQE